MDTAEIDLKDIIAILKRQRRLIVLTVLIVLGLGFAYILTAKPIYDSTTLLLVDSRGSNILETGAGEQQQSAVLNSRVDSEVEILRSDATALAVIQAANLIRDPEFGPQLGMLEKIGIALGTDLDGNSLRRLVGLAPKDAPTETALLNATIQKLQSAVDVRRRGLTYLIAISVSSEDPQRAAEIANTYAKIYLQRQVATKTSSTLDARDVLRRQIETAQAELASSEQAVNTFIEVNLARLEKESGDPAIAELRRSLQEAQAQKQQSNTLIASAEGAIRSGDWEAAAATLEDTALAELARQRKQLEQRINAATAGSAEVLDLRSELAKLEEDLTSQSVATIGAVRQEMSALTTRESEARDQLRSSLLQSDLSAEMLTELFNLQQSATIARNQYQTLLAREQDLGTMANLQIADARVVSEALPPNSAAAPKKRLIISLSMVMGLGLGVALAFLKEYYIGGVISASQLQNVLQAKVPVTVGEVDLAEFASPADAVVSAPLSVYAETFRKLRAAIDMSFDSSKTAEGQARGSALKRSANSGRVILVCSALQAEGKTTTAIALARTYAMSGARTLLIEADLRKPAIAGRLGIESKVGLLDYLVSAGADAIRQMEAAADPYSPLVVLTAGERSSAPTDQMINSVAFRNLLEIAIQNFDMVILDSPPLLPVVDTRYLARYADAVVQVVRYGSTTQGEVREAANQLQEMLPAGAQMFGVLSHEERAGRRYGYYGRYGGYYGQDES
ncbi:hypothetical protein GCM10011452_37080 [Gemmobacter lanyuensis]|uniref:non-specific protein-tyrosine kinase n=1 Tax=Gemmobacter lanyuensis TaxID=1054497 RepID=A0A918MP62_9RHOB|nr:polysaccharide biosynthesis tyrosine autokinase [Gemmobacter lanyuensis]GGW45531.1 hypothetical protein GCM10011452_37080 [Gemmobacter lanyuensis]